MGKIYLKKLTIKNLEELFCIKNDPDFLAFCTNRQKIKKCCFLKEVRKDFNKDKIIQYLIYIDNKLAGTIFVYSKNKRPFLTLFLFKEFRKKINSFLIMKLFLNYLYYQKNLIKIFFEMKENNNDCLFIFKKRKIELKKK